LIAELNDLIASSGLAQSGWELLAVVLSIAYLLLAVKENSLCWYAAFFSTLIFLFVFWDVSLLMESALQVYYMGMAIYGWWHWHHVKGKVATLPVSTWPLQRHVVAISSIVLISLASGFFLTGHTEARLPYLDSFTTWGSVFTTYLVAKKVLENWVYWLVIDSVSIYLYVDRGLYATALLFAVYIVIIFFGFIAWQKSYRQQIACAA
jgi:nicotinamide mononucleotide transporter